jgi:nucleotide-binding universal stress UspA family protein
MATQQAPAAAPALERRSIFERILVGVDGTKGSLDACRQAARLAEPGAAVEAAVVSLFPPAAATALGVDDLAERLERTASSALSAAAQILGPRAELRRLEGVTVDALIDEVRRIQGTLLAIGPPEHKRMEEIVLGGVGGELLHRAPCSILVARPVPDLATFPREIVVGIDGSEEAEHAYEVARNLATHRHSKLRSVVALGGKRVALDTVRETHPEVEADSRAPVPTLVDASVGADLLVVGSRGLHGPRALGSISERVAHRASSSILVVT